MATQPLLSNAFEIQTDAALRESAERVGYRVCPKVRLADVLKIDRSGIPDNEYSYALRAHFDFLITSEERGAPEFAVEFDGPHHDSDVETILRDRMKDALCEHLGLPLLRIDAAYLDRPTRRYSVVGWLVELWKLENEFYAAQERGEIPDDEPFCYFAVFKPAPERPGHGLFGESFALDGEATSTFVRAYQDGYSRTWMPEELSRDLWEGEDGYAPAYALFPLVDGGVIAGFARCRALNLGLSVTAGQLAGDLAVAQAGRNFLSYLDGDYEPLDPPAIKRIRDETSGWIRQGSPIDRIPPRLF